MFLRVWWKEDSHFQLLFEKLLENKSKKQHVILLKNPKT